MLLLKLLLVPSLIAIVSLAARRWGPRVGGLLVGLPLTSGPVALFLAVEQGPSFAALAARSTLLGLIPLAAFCIGYAVMSQWLGWQGSSIGGCMVFLLIAWPIKDVDLPLGVTAALVILGLGAASWALRRSGYRHARMPLPWWDVPLRMVAATALVLVLTEMARVLGPELSGVLAPFPVYAGVITAFTHRFEGRLAAAEAAGGVVFGSVTFAVFFWIVAGTLISWGILPSFGVAVAAAVLIHGIVFLGFVRRPQTRRRRAIAEGTK